jgi:NAD(P)-dependent dehydrogenase (short-subunit alcohol dehydrogenase family)
MDSLVHTLGEIDMPGRLQDRTALVTGSTDGIGVAIAHALGAEGARVIVSGRNTERGLAVVGSIIGNGGRAEFIPADLAAGRAAIGELVDLANARADGRIDILVNNAALLIEPSPTSQVSEELIEAALSVNVKAAFLLTGRIAASMVERGDGAIINLGSINGLVGMAGSALYSATKAAVHSLTKSWAAEYGPSGVRVNAVAPGPTLTTRVQAWQDHLAPMIAALPSRRASLPAEVAAAVVFLASDDASNIHGTILSVDGGAATV